MDYIVNEKGPFFWFLAIYFINSSEYMKSNRYLDAYFYM